MTDEGKTTSKGEPAGGAAQGTPPVTRKSPGEVKELPLGAFGPELKNLKDNNIQTKEFKDSK